MLQLGFGSSSTTLVGLLQTQTVVLSSAGMEGWAARGDEKLLCGAGMRFQNYNLRNVVTALTRGLSAELSQIVRGN